MHAASPEFFPSRTIRFGSTSSRIRVSSFSVLTDYSYVPRSIGWVDGLRLRNGRISMEGMAVVISSCLCSNAPSFSAPVLGLNNTNSRRSFRSGLPWRLRSLLDSFILLVDHILGSPGSGCRVLTQLRSGSQVQLPWLSPLSPESEIVRQCALRTSPERF